MSHVRKVVGRRQNTRADMLTRFGKELTGKVQETFGGQKPAAKLRAGAHGRESLDSAQRLDAVWKEQDAEREMHGDAAGYHFFAGMDDIGAK